MEDRKSVLSTFVAADDADVADVDVLVAAFVAEAAAVVTAGGGASSPIFISNPPQIASMIPFLSSNDES